MDVSWRKDEMIYTSMYFGHIGQRNIDLLFVQFNKNKLIVKDVNILLSISLNICFGCLKEPSHWEVSFECKQ